ncbi:UNVERIFIED_CONTAM: hypothetical protein RMT77_011980 [Armadillidium vulgare]
MEVSPNGSPPTSTASVPVSVTSRCLLPAAPLENEAKHGRSSFERLNSGEDSASERLDMPPDLALSTTDSDTESVSSIASKSEVVEEAEALLRGWTDRAAAQKVLDIVAALAKKSSEKEKQIEIVTKQSARLQKKFFSIKEHEIQQYRTREERLKEIEESLVDRATSPLSTLSIKSEEPATTD